MPRPEYLRADGFEEAALRFLAESEIQEMEAFLFVYHRVGFPHPGTGGVRETRWKGRHGKAKILFYYDYLAPRLVLLAAFPEDEPVVLSESTRKMLKRLLGSK